MVNLLSPQLKDLNKLTYKLNKMTVHVYLKYGQDSRGDYIEKIYSPTLLAEDDNLEYIGELDSHKKLSDDNERTYI